MSLLKKWAEKVLRLGHRVSRDLQISGSKAKEYREKIKTIGNLKNRDQVPPATHTVQIISLFPFVFLVLRHQIEIRKSKQVLLKVRSGY